MQSLPRLIAAALFYFVIVWFVTLWRHASPDIIRPFLKHGASLEAMNGDGKPPLDLAHKTLRDLIHRELQHISPTADTSEATAENTGVVEGGILVFDSSIYFISHLFSFLSVLALCPEDCYHILLFAYPSFFIFENSRRWRNKMSQFFLDGI